mmetsp:Transcript_8594/g.25533  ORF Transcript_8594/g.25533 Transcript_8594/m.25533 type:complete len:202 (+) Transcript_8594:798-1403(+)
MRALTRAVQRALVRRGGRTHLREAALQEQPPDVADERRLSSGLGGAEDGDAAGVLSARLDRHERRRLALARRAAPQPRHEQGEKGKDETCGGGGKELAARSAEERVQRRRRRWCWWRRRRRRRGGRRIRQRLAAPPPRRRGSRPAGRCRAAPRRAATRRPAAAAPPRRGTRGRCRRRGRAASSRRPRRPRSMPRRPARRRQ